MGGVRHCRHMNNEATNIVRKTKMKYMLGNGCLEMDAWKYEGRHGITRLALQVICIADVFTHSVVIRENIKNTNMSNPKNDQI